MESPTPAELVERLRRDGLRIAVAESCTGGRVCAEIVSVPGASDVFVGGVVAYADEPKHSIVGVSKDVLARFGAVSAACAEAMAHGVRARFGADVGVAVTGIAGPEGARPGKPVGTVWLAVVGPARIMMVHKGHFDGDRAEIQHEAVAEALALAWGNLMEAEREGQVEVRA
jgi:PncC family amidohydrolase